VHHLKLLGDPGAFRLLVDPQGSTSQTGTRVGHTKKKKCARFASGGGRLSWWALPSPSHPAPLPPPAYPLRITQNLNNVKLNHSFIYTLALCSNTHCSGSRRQVVRCASLAMRINKSERNRSQPLKWKDRQRFGLFCGERYTFGDDSLRWIHPLLGSPTARGTDGRVAAWQGECAKLTGNGVLEMSDCIVVNK
jgi:hypothetical protein